MAPLQMVKTRSHWIIKFARSQGRNLRHTKIAKTANFEFMLKKERKNSDEKEYQTRRVVRRHDWTSKHWASLEGGTKGVLLRATEFDHGGTFERAKHGQETDRDLSNSKIARLQQYGGAEKRLQHCKAKRRVYVKILRLYWRFESFFDLFLRLQNAGNCNVKNV